jgi:protein O-GlcNAc transferase
VLVYLDVGMEPSTVVWASARLAPIQICVWGHPTTTGLQHMDYFMSSQLFHNSREQRMQMLTLESNGMRCYGTGLIFVG